MQKKAKHKLIYIAPTLATFIKNDISVLKEDFNVKTNVYHWKNKKFVPFFLLFQFFFLLFNLFQTKVIVISFGGYWSFLPSLIGKIFKIPVVIILNGTDSVSFEEINYGDLRKKRLRFVIKKSYQWASMLLPVSSSLIETSNDYFSDKTLTLGIRPQLGIVDTPWEVIHNGIDVNFWKRNSKIERLQNSFITVLSPGQELRKGIYLILEIAPRFPESKFLLGGINRIEGVDLPNNVECIGRLSPAELRDWYSGSQFYLQLSNYEGFGVALCEAMLCECIPIGSNVNYIPEIIGDSGFVLKKGSPQQLQNLLIEALSSAQKAELEKRAKKRIEENYSLKSRKDHLLEVINQLT